MIKKNLWLIMAVALFVVVISIVAAIEDTADIEPADAIPTLPKVAVISVVPQSHVGEIEVLAEVSSRWQSRIRAQVGGEVLEVAARALAGKPVNKGDRLLSIDNRLYMSQLHEAEQLVAQAEIQLSQEKQRTRQAYKDWQRSGLKKAPSDLVLNKPQLALAHKTLQAAKSRLAAARRRLDHTLVVAPFSGYITQRHVSLGQTVDQGDALLDIIGRDEQDIRLSLSDRQWQLLSKEWSTHRAALYLVDGPRVGEARITHGGEFLDPKTRQTPVYLQVDVTRSQVRSGTFVRVTLPTVAMANSLKVPEGAVTREGKVWFVDHQGYLKNFTAEVLFDLRGERIIAQPAAAALGGALPDQWQIATTPLASFLSGRKVQPITVGGQP